LGTLSLFVPFRSHSPWLRRIGSLRNTSSHGREPLEDVDEQEPEAR
jgi:hypothetical protein